MACQSLFSEKDKKNIISLSSAKLAKRVVKVNNFCYFCTKIWVLIKIATAR